MKQITTLLGCLLLCSLFIQPLHAQEKGQEEARGIVVIKEITNADGSTTTIKKRLQPGESLDAYLEALTNDTGQAAGRPDKSAETLFMFRGASSTHDEVREIRIVQGAEEDDWSFDFDYNDDYDGPSPRPQSQRLTTEKAQKAFIGIYPGHAEEGVRINGLVSGGGAEQAGLQRGDLITTVGGFAVNGRYGLRSALTRIEPGSTVEVTYLRDGQEQSTMVTMGETEYERRVLNRDADPCPVFIGVYVGGRSALGQGVQVTNIIGNTPADEIALQAGDIILAMDGIPVNSNGELLKVRDTHKPGEAFTLEVQRGTAIKVFDARFPSCEEQQENAPVEPEPEDISPIDGIGSQALQLNRYRAFPNPSFGQLQLQFEGDAVPTTVQLVDATGRIIYNEQLNQFDGVYNRELDLSDAAPGTLTLTIRQGGQAIARQIVLLNRA